jgi:hypothetical protein
MATRLEYTWEADPEGGVCITAMHGDEQGKVQHWPDITPNQMKFGQRLYDAGWLIQDAFPFLSAERREFLLTGLDAEDWAELEAVFEAEEMNDLCPRCGKPYCHGYCGVVRDE